jgi:nitroreductase
MSNVPFPELVKQARSIRRFVEADPIPAAEVRRLVDIARFVPSASNQQPSLCSLCYLLQNDLVAALLRTFLFAVSNASTRRRQGFRLRRASAGQVGGTRAR